MPAPVLARNGGPMPERRQAKFRPSEKAWAAWDRTCTTEGVTLTGLLEAIALDMADGKWSPTARMLRQARLIDRERHSR